MIKCRAYDIEWDTDNESPDLPNEVFFEVDDNKTDEDIQMEAPDIISDEYGWCVKGFLYERVDKIDNKMVSDAIVMIRAHIWDHESIYNDVRERGEKIIEYLESLTKDNNE